MAVNNVERREQIVEILRNSTQPVSGSRLASMLNVSRQVIVQDIALLRTEHPILATAQGYLLYEVRPRSLRRTYMVKHDYEDMLEELLTVVNAGGHVLDVIVEHDVYGEIRADLNIASVKDVEDFYSLISKSKSEPLYLLSGGVHLHTVEADTEQILDKIEKVFKEKGWLI